MFQRFSRLSVGLIGVYLSTQAHVAAQTQVDLSRQSKAVDFQGAQYTKPLKTSATLPATCTTNELLLLTTAPAGTNIYACLTPNNWVSESSPAGVVAIQNNGAAIGSPGTENFIPGLGVMSAITDLGTVVNIQQGVDTSVVTSNVSLQSGQALLCQSASGSGTTYTCQLNPTLTTYSPGMVLNWKPDVNGTGGPTTLNVDLLGPIPVLEPDGLTNLSSQDIASGRMYTVWYDGTEFRVLNPSSQSGGGSSSTPVSITSTTAGGPTTVTAATEWHAALALCASSTGSVLIWNVPPPGITPATAAGCSGTNVNDPYAGFANAGTPSVQTSFTLPRTLTGTADVYVTYQEPVAGSTFTPALDVVCTPANGSSANDPTFIANNFFAPGSVTTPAVTGALGTVSALGLAWPAGCTGGSRAHLRLIRTDTTGTAAAVNVAEVVVVLRRVL